ncbi:MAG TPA: tetratricopeptide repeat protein, partial [Polyangia bacterium]
MTRLSAGRLVVVAALAAAAAGCHKKTEAPATAPAAVPPAIAAPTLYDQGKVALDQKHYSEAVDYFTRATTAAADPELRANAWLGLGAAYGELGDHARAIAAYEQVTVLR